MIISAKMAKKLIEEGKAGSAGFVWASGVDHRLTEPEFVAIDRYDFQRVDHYKPETDDLDKWITDCLAK